MMQTVDDGYQQSEGRCLLQRLPLGWNILETNRTVGGLFGYSSENSIRSLNVPAETEKEREWVCEGFAQVTLWGEYGCGGG